MTAVIAFLIAWTVSLPNASAHDEMHASAIATRTIPVVVLKYFPLTQDGQNIDINVTGDVGDPLVDVQARVDAMTTRVAAALSEGSKYRGYVDSGATAEATYTVVDTKEFHTPVPAVPSSLNPSYPMRADYTSIMASIDICDYVTNKGVDQVWIWAYQGPHQLDISESKMSGPYGDISNSYRLNDMPECGRTYTVYTYNYGRGTAEAIHDHGHQLEAELAEVDSHLFRDLFEGTTPYPAGIATGRCGSIHNPPNARFEYDWANPTANPTDCLAWTPDSLGPTTDMSCSTWGCSDNGDENNPQRNWIVFWMQNLPGAGNSITFHGRPMRDWWDVHFDFDTVMGTCKTLVMPCAVVAPSAHMTALPIFERTTPIPLAWSATPGSAPITSYDVRYRRAPNNGNFGSYATWKTATASTSAMFSASAGYTYCFESRARDAFDSISAWTAETCTAIPLDDRSLSRSANWTAGTSTAYFKSTFLRSSTSGAALVRTGVVARRLAILVTSCSSCGTIRVYWNGILLRTMSLASSSTIYRNVVVVTTFTTVRSGTLTLKVYGTGKRVYVDGVIIRRI
jgi:hypothetical protein